MKVSPAQEITALRKEGQLEEAYAKGYELLKSNPEDKYLASAIGWVLYEKIKNLVTTTKKSQSPDEGSSNNLRNILLEYVKLEVTRPDLLFSLLLSQVLQFPSELKFLPKFMMWAGVNSFRAEDFQTHTGNDGKVFESLVEKVARTTGKISRDLTLRDYPDLGEVQDFAITLIDFSLKNANVQKPEWLHYHKALLLNQSGRSEDSQKLLTSFVQQKRSDYWTWHALAKVVEISDSKLALALCAKACLTCKDENFGVNVFEDLSRLASHQNEIQIAKWATKQAFDVRNRNGWKIPQALRNLLNSPWYAHSESIPDAKEILFRLSVDAETIIWSQCPKYDANYLETFTTQKGTRMLKFALKSYGEAKEIVSPERGMVNNLTLTFGDPVIVTIDESGDRPTVVAVKKRESGQPFDIMPCRSGQFKLKPAGFGFVDNVYVPHELASQLKDNQIVNLVTAKRFDKKKNKWSLNAIAILDELG
ncbi:hypothetical protein Syn7502_02349 [Synechococcus sp. PCC 7502]|uniref:DUF7017 domain-containing protein n=1 Tax=Synechococcus sp. PCC 7502 TaxID=1173263 RepID=UPI00029FE7AA|nr:hypothetical protein [Synechococcus sp. PCC 7502]AFY74344.1 hypothetical protein Syn7502_02349 [Synechococcus sp. PCC 7502]